jgi:hypothetical protein
MPKEDKDAAASGSDSSVSDHKDEKPAASSSKGKDKDDDELSPKRKRKAPVSEINEDLLEDDEKLKLEQRRAYNRACAAKVCQCHKDLNLLSFSFLEIDARLIPSWLFVFLLTAHRPANEARI